MARIRLGKQERALRKDQWSTFRQVRAEVVKGNLSQPKPKQVGKYASLRDLGAYGARAKVSQLIIKQDSSTRNKMLAAKFKVGDLDLYTERLDVTGGGVEENQVRVGTTKRKQPIYAPVGKQGSVPKDGGK